MVRIVGETGAPRAINGLTYIGEEAFFGKAVTLRSLPSRPDNNGQISEHFRSEHGIGPYQYAISLCDEGSVLVIEARGTSFFAAAGGTGLSSLLGRKAAALLTDGQIRDSRSLEEHAKKTGTAIISNGFTPHYGTGRMLMPAQVNVPVALHDTLILPGDYLFGDRDGIVVIPESVAEEVLETSVILNRAAQVMEEWLIERGGILGIDIKGIKGPVEDEMKKRFSFSDRQLELWRKNVEAVR